MSKQRDIVERLRERADREQKEMDAGWYDSYANHVAIAESREAAAEIERMRPVYEAAMAVDRNTDQSKVIELLTALFVACAKVREGLNCKADGGGA